MNSRLTFPTGRPKVFYFTCTARWIEKYSLKFTSCLNGTEDRCAMGLPVAAIRCKKVKVSTTTCYLRTTTIMGLRAQVARKPHT